MKCKAHANREISNPRMFLRGGGYSSFIPSFEGFGFYGVEVLSSPSNECQVDLSPQCGNTERGGVFAKRPEVHGGLWCNTVDACSVRS